MLQALHEPTARIVAELKLARGKLEFAAPRSMLLPTIRAFERAERCLKRPLRFAIMGEFNSGKSSLANLLARVECLPTAVVSNTRIPTLLYYAHEPEIWAVDKSGRREWLRADQEVASQGAFRLDVGLPSQGLRAVQYLDLPGLADPRSRAPAIIDLALHHIDAVLWCTMSTQAWKESERAAWSQLPQRLRARGLLVSTHGDLLNNAGDADKLLRRLQGEASELFRDIVVISTVTALAALRSDSETPVEPAWSTTGAKALDAALHRLLRQVQELRAAAAIKMTCRIVERARWQLEGSRSPASEPTRPIN